MSMKIKKILATIIAYTLVIGFIPQSTLTAKSTSVPQSSTSTTFFTDSSSAPVKVELSQDTARHAYQPTSGSFAVTCSEKWSAEVTCSFITVARNGNIVNYKVTENGGRVQRTGYIYITGATGILAKFMIIQDPKGQTQISPESANFGYQASSGSISVPYDDPWTIVVTHRFVTAVKISSDTVTYSIAENTSSFKRTANIFIMGSTGPIATFTITQDGKPNTR